MEENSRIGILTVNTFGLCIGVQLGLVFGLAALFWPDKFMPLFDILMFPWAASGRSLALNRDEGFTKLLFDPETRRVIGAGMVGTSAGDLIAEVALAIEMGADATDIGLTIHPHPTLSETVAFAAEAFDGTLTDLYMPKR